MNIKERAVSAFVGALMLASCSGGAGSSPVPPSGMAPNSAFARSTAAQRGSVRPLCGPVPLGANRCFALIRTDVRFERLPAEAASSKLYYGGLGAPQLEQAYDLPSSSGGAGQTIGIVDAYDDPTAETDMNAYRKQFKLPQCTTANGCFRKLNDQGQASPLPKPNGGWAGEISLDLDMASAICPKCHIVLVEAETSYTEKGVHGLGPAATAAAGAGATVISNSYGGSECITNNQGKVECQSPLPYAHYYSIPKVIVTASTGDYTWFAGPQTPADFGTVVAVGGTSMFPYNNSRGWVETAWEGAGSGCSLFVKRPSWQPSSIGCAKGMRGIADVSAVADPFTGVFIYETYPASKGAFYIIGGTSASSPIVASTFALAGNAATLNFGGKLYTASSGSLNDVTIGTNGTVGELNDAGQQCTPVAVCVSGPGWDGPTGNGTPWGLKAF